MRTSVQSTTTTPLQFPLREPVWHYHAFMMEASTLHNNCTNYSKRLTSQHSPAFHVYTCCAYKRAFSDTMSFCVSSCVMLYFSPLIFWQHLLFSGGLTKKYDVIIPLRERCGNKDREPLWTLRWKHRPVSLSVMNILVWVYIQTYTLTSTVKKSILWFVFSAVPVHFCLFLSAFQLYLTPSSSLRSALYRALKFCSTLQSSAPLPPAHIYPLHFLKAGMIHRD